tara:strand:+ start:639 stop:1073 length:435 start_codon:yes stop_codon:yes gene_type:complete
MIFIGNDHGGYRLAMKLYEKMANDYMHVYHHGCVTADLPTDYPVFAKRVCDAVADFELHYRGILVCGTGIGMSMVANRHHMIRAALCERPSDAKLAREHNNANVLCLAGRRLTFEDAWPVVEAFLHTPFSKEERHEKRIGMFPR